MTGLPQVGSVQRTSDLDKVWSDASAKYLVDQAGQLRESAGKWAQNATAILSVAGLATAFKGRETLVSIDPAWHGLLVAAVGGTLVLSGLALLAAALATSGAVDWTWNDPTSFRTAQVAAAAATARWLKASKWLVTGAFLASIVAVGIIWTAPKAPSTPSKTLVIAGDAVLCGELGVANGRIEIDGKPIPKRALLVQTVAECPR